MEDEGPWGKTDLSVFRIISCRHVMLQDSQVAAGRSTHCHLKFSKTVRATEDRERWSIDRLWCPNDPPGLWDRKEGTIRSTNLKKLKVEKERLELLRGDINSKIEICKTAIIEPTSDTPRRVEPRKSSLERKSTQKMLELKQQKASQRESKFITLYESLKKQLRAACNRLKVIPLIKTWLIWWGLLKGWRHKWEMCLEIFNLI